MPGTYTKNRFNNLEKDLDVALHWLGEFGFECNANRLGYYKKSFNRLMEVYRTKDEDVTNDEFSDLVNTLFETHELILIHEGLGNGKYDDYLRDKAKELGKGPINYKDEDSSSSNRARNIAFELLLASRLAASGMPLDYSMISDTACQIDNRTILLECKRPLTINGIEANVKKAHKQLERQYRNPQKSRCRGVVAIDISRAVNPESHLLVSSNGPSIGRKLEQVVESFIDDHVDLWQSNKSSKTIAILVRISLMGIDQEQEGQLVYCQQYGLSPLPGSGARNIATADELGRLLSTMVSNNAPHPTQ